MIVVDGENYILTEKKREELRNTININANTILGNAYRIVLFSKCDRELSNTIFDQSRRCKIRREFSAVETTVDSDSPIERDLKRKELLLNFVKDIIRSEGICSDLDDIEKVLKKDM